MSSRRCNLQHGRAVLPRGPDLRPKRGAGRTGRPDSGQRTALVVSLTGTCPDLEVGSPRGKDIARLSLLRMGRISRSALPDRRPSASSAVFFSGERGSFAAMSKIEGQSPNTR